MRFRAKFRFSPVVSRKILFEWFKCNSECDIYFHRVAGGFIHGSLARKEPIGFRFNVVDPEDYKTLLIGEITHDYC